MIFISHDELCFHLTKWQAILRLKDWDISAHIVSKEEMNQSIEDADCESLYEGYIHANEETKEAEIKILDASYWTTEYWMMRDHELTLVHELLHIHFIPFEAKKKSRKLIAQEQAINLIAKALVHLKRQGQDELKALLDINPLDNSPLSKLAH
jgi:hypothetical protein